jgi:acetyl esterase/lipase
MTRLLARAVAEHGAGEVVLMGDSAGGGMALAVAQQHRDCGGPALRRVVLISPWLDVATDHPDQLEIAPRDLMLRIPVAQEAGRLYAGELPVDDPRVSPLHGDLRGLPPVDVFVGTDELVLVDATRLEANAKESGAVVHVDVGRDMQHVYPILPLLPEGAAARRRIVELCRLPLSQAGRP